MAVVQQKSRPEIRTLTRREVMALMATIAAAPLHAAAQQNLGAAGPEYHHGKVTLPKLPSHGPGFSAHNLDGGELLLWARGIDGAVIAYRLNANGRKLWALCNGRHSKEMIAQSYRRMTGRPAVEANDFVSSLIDIGVIAAGGYVVPTGSFPLAPGGNGYHVLLDDPSQPEDPPQSQDR